MSGPAFDGARERHGRAAHFGEGPLRLDADVDVHAAGTAGFGPPAKAHSPSKDLDFERDRAYVLPGNARPGIEVYAQFVGMVEIGRPDGMRMEFDASQVHDPGQAGSIVHHHLFRGSARRKRQATVRSQEGRSFGARF